MGRPWRITIARAGQPVKLVDACWSQPRCAAKRRMIESLLVPGNTRR